MIAQDSVEKACSEVSEYTDQEMVREFDRFFRAQPSISEFIFQLTQESGQTVQELSLFLSYMVFKAIEVDPGSGSVSIVNVDDLNDAYKETQSWIDEVSRIESSKLETAVASSIQLDSEPYLMRYVISELNEPLAAGAELTEEDKGEVLFVLKTIISSFRAKPKGKIIEIS
jgi:hypothetical protein